MDYSLLLSRGCGRSRYSLYSNHGRWTHGSKGMVEKREFVISAGSYQELDPEAVPSADKIVVDSWAQTSHRGELARLVEAGKLGERNIHAEIGEILAGKKKGREREDENILAVPIGLGSLDIGCAFEVYQKAVEKKIGTLFSFIKTAPENPVLWTGMKGASAKGRKKRPDAETSSA